MVTRILALVVVLLGLAFAVAQQAYAEESASETSEKSFIRPLWLGASFGYGSTFEDIEEERFSSPWVTLTLVGLSMMRDSNALTFFDVDLSFRSSRSSGVDGQFMAVVGLEFANGAYSDFFAESSDFLFSIYLASELGLDWYREFYFDDTRFSLAAALRVGMRAYVHKNGAIELSSRLWLNFREAGWMISLGAKFLVG